MISLSAVLAFLAPVMFKREEKASLTRATLLAAADLIEKNGLAKYTREDEITGGLCIHGAIAKAATGHAWAYDSDPRITRTFLAIDRVLATRDYDRRKIMVFPDGFAEWNNAPETTKADVLGVLREAAAL
jgi:hypothetical protein